MCFRFGSTAQVVALDEDKHYAGIISIAEAHTPELDETIAVSSILHFTDTVLLPTMTVKEAVVLFDKAEAEALAVIGAPQNREVVGLLTEAYALAAIPTNSNNAGRTCSASDAGAFGTKRTIAAPQHL